MDAIVYTSESGFTKEYAEMLSKKTGLPACELREIKSAPFAVGARIVYLGWLMAGSIQGLKKAAGMFDVCAVCAVGMGAPGSQTPDSLRTQNSLAATLPVYYLQGGYREAGLSGLHRFMMGFLRRTVGKKLAQKPDKTAEEADMLDLLCNGGSRVTEDQLDDVVALCEKDNA